jgi:hypothetical protein
MSGGRCLDHALARRARERPGRRPARHAGPAWWGRARGRRSPAAARDRVVHGSEPSRSAAGRDWTAVVRRGAGAGRATGRAGRRGGSLRVGRARLDRGRLGKAARRARRHVSASDARALLGLGRFGVRARIVRRRALLLSARRQGLSRPLVLRRLGATLRRAGRVRARVRHRPRGGAPRAEPARHQRQGGPGAPTQLGGGRERDLGPPRAAGRLLRRRLGSRRRPRCEPARTGRRRIWARRGRRDR